MNIRNAMASWSVLVLVSLSILACTDESPVRLDKRAIEDMLASIDEASRSADLKPTLDHFAPGALIIFRLPDAAGAGVLRLSPEEYSAAIADASRSISDYSYTRESTEIELAENTPAATVRYVVRESARIDGERVRTLTRYELDVARYNSDVRITRVLATSRTE